jgi:hypothetical protein
MEGGLQPARGFSPATASFARRNDELKFAAARSSVRHMATKPDRM